MTVASGSQHLRIVATSAPPSLSVVAAVRRFDDSTGVIVKAVLPGVKAPVAEAFDAFFHEQHVLGRARRGQRALLRPRPFAGDGFDAADVDRARLRAPVPADAGGALHRLRGRERRCSLGGEAHDCRRGTDHVALLEPAPAFRFLFKSLSAGFCNGVILGLMSALGSLPGPTNPTLVFEAHERRIKRALIESKRMIGDLL